jgi:hypothetical protein
VIATQRVAVRGVAVQVKHNRFVVFFLFHRASSFLHSWRLVVRDPIRSICTRTDLESVYIVKSSNVRGVFAIKVSGSVPERFSLPQILVATGCQGRAQVNQQNLSQSKYTPNFAQVNTLTS